MARRDSGCAAGGTPVQAPDGTGGTPVPAPGGRHRKTRAATRAGGAGSFPAGAARGRVQAGPRTSPRMSLMRLIPRFAAGAVAGIAARRGAAARRPARYVQGPVPGNVHGPTLPGLPGPTLTIVAHEDDDLLFITPGVLRAIRSGSAVRTVYLTAGDDGLPASYWLTREDGPKAAYALMAGTANSWTESDAGIAGHPIPLFTLSGNPGISLAYMRLPDGNLTGTGFASTGQESLQRLWQQMIPAISAVNGSSSYTQSSLIATLASLMTAFGPAQILTQDFVGTYGCGDHSDHYTTAYLTQAAAQQYAAPHIVTGYQGYGTENLPSNVSGADLSTKQSAFYAYAKDDPQVCDSRSGCVGSDYAIWLLREYAVFAAGAPPVAYAGADQTVSAGEMVTLDGSGSFDPGGDALTYQWTQTGGAAVTLSSDTVMAPAFTAPGAAGPLTFRLVVSDGTGPSSPAHATVTVTGGGPPGLLLTAATAASAS